MAGPFDPRDPFSNPLNKIKVRLGTNQNPNDLLPQYNQSVVNPESPDYRTHRGYVIGSGRQFQAGTERVPRPDHDR